MTQTFFITGTDTEVGKTLVATALLTAAKRQGLSTAAVKPVAAGCRQTPDGLRNEDALQLQGAMTLKLTYEQINPVALEAAVAPHIAAAAAGKNIRVARLAGFCRGVIMQSCDLVLVEGAGGWRVPLNPREYLSDLARELNLGVILVVGMRLGCINHAVLTAEAVVRDGLSVAGWVANRVDPHMSCYRENLEALTGLLPCPCLGKIPFLPEANPEAAADYLDIQKLINKPRQ